MKMNRIIIVEDIALNRMMIEATLASNGYEVVGSSANAIDAWRLIKEKKPELVLLDVHLKGNESGVWLGHKIREELRIPFIYITAYHDQETISEIMQTEPMGFIAKPIIDAQLLATVNIALNLSTSIQSNVVAIHDGNKMYKLNAEEILYLNSEANYVHVHLKSSHLLVRNSLTKIEENLPKELFVRIHLRTIVNRYSTMKILGNSLIINGTTLQISAPYKNTALDALK
jgi:DNA-binding LytR/AlgR family response regulator